MRSRPRCCCTGAGTSTQGLLAALAPLTSPEVAVTSVTCPQPLQLRRACPRPPRPCRAEAAMSEGPGRPPRCCRSPRGAEPAPQFKRGAVASPAGLVAIQCRPPRPPEPVLAPISRVPLGKARAGRSCPPAGHRGRPSAWWARGRRAPALGVARWPSSTQRALCVAGR